VLVLFASNDAQYTLEGLILARVIQYFYTVGQRYRGFDVFQGAWNA